jgi:type II secretory pathway component PulM
MTRKKKIFIGLGLILGLIITFSIFGDPKQEAAAPKAAVKVNEVAVKSYNGKVDEYIKKSNGVIVNIQHTDDYKYIKMTVSDAWYNSTEMDQQRFANQMFKNLSFLVHYHELIKKDDALYMEIYDTYDHKVSSYSAFKGEMKIEK